MTIRQLPPTTSHRRPGRWYFVVPIVTFGLFTWIPFLHAATRSRQRRHRLLALVYGALAALLVTLANIAPKDARGNPAGTLGTTLNAIFGIAALASIVVGCVQLARVRTETYGPPPAVFPPPPLASDPVIAQHLAARARRQEARALAARDSVLARDLRIGRPDLPRQYEDGGLVDLNSAPAEVIATVCGLSPADAGRIVGAREKLGGFDSLDELFVYTQIQGAAAELVRERGVLLPR
ncbi:ComEA family DNA-binding protein [Streptacidiphilus anmyonensis]|uniref:ComEA family DNA-binding protein n=1 Tax=Streptacidiphilus anmyonensis TaxID=405782 RepID=UPI0005AA6B16|nr:helix-hairpin-helix domain-containing protein [Streptacidiphilus anmyonensis]